MARGMYVCGIAPPLAKSLTMMTAVTTRNTTGVNGKSGVRYGDGGIAPVASRLRCTKMVAVVIA